MITIKQFDTGIGLKATLSNDEGNIDLSKANVVFKFNKHKVNVDVEDAQTGAVSVVLNENHTSKVGVFSAEFLVTFQDGRAETFPNDNYLKLQIMKGVNK